MHCKFIKNIIRVCKRIHASLINAGLNIPTLIRAIVSIPTYIKDYLTFSSSKNKDFGKVVMFPCLVDRFDAGGSASGHYFHQDLLIARRIFENTPHKHVDIGSRVDGFVAHVASFREIEVIDIRENPTRIKNIAFKQVDFMQSLPKDMHQYCDSVSCLHALEHFGLGRYGDDICADGFLKGIDNIFNLCKSGGKVYLSVPIGVQRIEFNAHRVFSVRYFLSILQNKFDLNKFSYVDDSGCLHEEVELNDSMIDNSCECHYGCGIFELQKKK